MSTGLHYLSVDTTDGLVSLEGNGNSKRAALFECTLTSKGIVVCTGNRKSKGHVVSEFEDECLAGEVGAQSAYSKWPTSWPGAGKNPNSTDHWMSTMTWWS